MGKYIKVAATVIAIEIKTPTNINVNPYDLDTNHFGDIQTIFDFGLKNHTNDIQQPFINYTMRKAGILL